MIIDEKYQDNIVLKKDAFQELLTNIKNYPVIDIDYIEENELDWPVYQTNPSDNTTIWSRYTDNTPCIRITYGDNETYKGKSSLLTGRAKMDVELAKAELAILYKDLQQQQKEKERWELIKKTNENLKELKENEIQIFINKYQNKNFIAVQNAEDGLAYIQDENYNQYMFSKVIQDTYAAMMNIVIQYYTPNNFSNDLYNVEFNFTPALFTFQEDNGVIKIYKNSNEIQSFNSFQELENYILSPSASFPPIPENNISVIQLKIFEDFSSIKGAIFNNNDNNSNNNIYSRIIYNYDKLKQIDPSHTTQYETEKDRALQAFKALETNFLNYESWLVVSYTDTVNDIQIVKPGQDVIDFINTMNEYITDYFASEIDDKINRATDKLNSITNSISTIEQQIQTKKSNIQTIIDELTLTEQQQIGIKGYKYVKVGSSINVNDNEAGFEILNNKNGFTRNPAGQPNGLYWDNDDDDSTPLVKLDQPFGTIRITGNGNVYEVKVQGLDTDQNGHPIINGPVTISGNTTIDGELDVKGPLITYKTIDGTPTPIQIGGDDVDLGGDNQADIDGYGNPIYFWRSDGAWSNILNNDLQLKPQNSSVDDNGNIYGKALILSNKDDNNYTKDVIMRNVYTKNLIDTQIWRQKVSSNNVYYKAYKRIKAVPFGTPFPANIDYGDGEENQRYWLRTCDSATHQIWFSTPYYGGGSAAGANETDWNNYVGTASAHPTNALLYEITDDTTVDPVEVYVHQAFNDFTIVNNREYFQLTYITHVATQEQGYSYYVTVTDYTQMITPDFTNYLIFYQQSGSGSWPATLDMDHGYFQANKVFNAVFNDYAEYRQTIDLTPGHCVIDNDDGSLSCTTERLQPGVQVISDTFGSSMGMNDKCQTPLAVAGRVLVYPYQYREKYHAGMAVCSAPGGTVDIMTREEIKNYPDCIVGIVSEIPQYDTWGTDNVKVDGRIWIKVK